MAKYAKGQEVQVPLTGPHTTTGKILAVEVGEVTWYTVYYEVFNRPTTFVFSENWLETYNPTV